MSLVRTRVLLALMAICTVLFVAGCGNSDLEGKYDEKKLPPKPTDGRGPSASGATAAGGDNSKPASANN